jgi:DNA-binding beta-propeller fold protein YncE
MRRALGTALVVTGALWAQGALADCNKPATQPIVQTAVSGNPFSAIPTPDGCAIFVSLTAARQSHIAVLKRDDGTVTQTQNLAIEGTLTGMALSPDGKILAAADGAGLVLLDSAKLVAGASDAVIAKADDGPHAGSVYVAFSPDGRLVVIANERSASLSVYETAGLKPVGVIPVASAPVGLAFSADGTRLYSTSEVGPRAWPAKCTSEGPPHPEGVLLVIDVAKAASEPARRSQAVSRPAATRSAWPCRRMGQPLMSRRAAITR